MPTRSPSRVRDGGTSPPRPAEVAAALHLDEKSVKEAIDLLVRAGTLTKVQDLWFDRGALDLLASPDRIRAAQEEFARTPS